MLLSTHRTVNGVREIYQPTGTEFEAFMDSGYNFQNALMKFMHAMNPTLVPESIDDSSESTLFKPVNKGRNDADYGVLQMMVPHWTKEDGKYYEVAENVYISFGFFGDEFSGFKKVNYDAANRGLDDLNVSNNLDGFDLSQVMVFGRAGYSGVPSLNMLEVAEDNIMQDKSSIEHDIDPDKDGVDHINVYSQGKTDLGKFLSNFAHTPIDLPEGHFESIEGYWHYLGLPDNCREKSKLKKLWGAEARSVGRGLRKRYGTKHKSDFKDKIRHAIDVKLLEYQTLWVNDDAVFLPLEHYYVFKDGRINDQRKQFGWLTDMIQEEIDLLLSDKQ